MGQPGTPPQAWFIYGTAWKESATAAHTVAAVRAGFRAIDTANQPKHYQEALVGDAVAQLVEEGIARRDLFLQTKFTPLDGLDHRVPYDPRAPLKTQVQQSFESSLRHLRTAYVDAYLLHGPYSGPGLVRADWEVWGAIEDIYRSGQARAIGISNVSALQLTTLIRDAAVPPQIVQNRCLATRGWDRQVRDICRTHDITYQAFSLLTANPRILKNANVLTVARRLRATPEQVIFRFAIQAGMVPMTGTTLEEHMKADLAVKEMRLEAEEVALIESLAG